MENSKEIDENEAKLRRKERIRTFLIIALFLLIFAAFINYRIGLVTNPPPSSVPDYAQYPWYEIPFIYIYNYIKSAGISLAYAFALGGIIQEFVPQDAIKKWLNKNRISSYFIAAAIAPIFITCSCSVVPIYVGLLVAGASMGVVMTFFLMAPAASFITLLLTGEYLGWDLSLFRLLFSFIAAVACGILFDKSKFGKDLEEKYRSMQVGAVKRFELKKTFDDRIYKAGQNGIELVKSILPLLLLGLAIVSYIAAYLPDDIITQYFTGFWGIFFGALLGGPVYTPALVEIVLTKSLLDKGMARSSALAFMMGQPYDFVSIPPNAKYFKWQGVVLYSLVFFIMSIVAGVVYALIYGIPL
jgi:uncharacterized membrane protein YraQ (UPF0718 family)